ncbi:MAG: phosphomannomutase/phosphoglucomutase [Actinomycetales bacterium]|nr:phosphomannomutase/phosphoglucomutase [Actinomycetales bacterium]
MDGVAGLFKAYDIRGRVPGELSDDVVRLVGGAAVAVLGVHRQAGGPGAFVIGRDMRPSGAGFAAALAEGITAAGVDVIDIGLASTDQCYYASGALDLPAAMITASHNPAGYNGIKLARPGAAPVGEATGLREIRDRVLVALADGRRVSARSAQPGHLTNRDILADYVDCLHRLVPLSGLRPLRVVIDAGSGMAGLTAPAVFAGTPVTVAPLYFELDGTFPFHEANPIDSTTLVDLQQRVVDLGADAGIAFDGDADRAFFVTESGELVNPSTVTALIAEREIAREPGATIIHNLITSRRVPEVVTRAGGIPVRTRVGHSFIKEVMAQTGAVFGGEHSGHFYFREFWRADSGMLAACHVLAALGQTPPGTPVSAVLADYACYPASGEINTAVDDAAAVLAEVRARYCRSGAPASAGSQGTAEPARCDDLDGLTVETATWRFNVRPSNTEPLLRLNVEADDQATLERVRDEVLGLIRGGTTRQER